ncbi:uncharacterized protein LOC132702252 [Cylas formicarius]|uniref:uncharacterized protein LOC132702252 n=1 Tax=Cylas formicarius TaxID=197179 RepID=UPI0029587FEB|nr:uncharacterized protein LOC132702252 [Cylas formicarius]
MFKPLLLVTGVALFLTQVQGDAALDASKDDVKKAFESMMKAIDKALTQAQSALDKALEQVETKAHDLEDKAKAEIQGAVSKLQEKLDKLVEEAKEKGFDVSACEKYVTEFTNLPDTLVDELVSCATTQVEKAKGYIDDALKNAQQIEQDLAKIDDDIDNCSGNKIKQLKCYAKLLEEIVKDTSSAPQHIVEDVTKATTLVTGILPVLEACATGKVESAGTKAAEIVAEFALCAGLNA